MAFRKLTPKELEASGFSRKAERYLNTETGQTVSKRQAQKAKQIGSYAPATKPKSARHVRAGRMAGKSKKLTKEIGKELAGLAKYHMNEAKKFKKGDPMRAWHIQQGFDLIPEDLWQIYRDMFYI